MSTKIPPKNMRWPAPAGIPAEDAYPRDWVVSQTEASLERLGLETIDVQQFHVWSDEWVGQGDWLDAVAGAEGGREDPRLRRLDQRPSAGERGEARRVGRRRHRAGDLQRLRAEPGGRAVPRGRGGRGRCDRAGAVRRGLADRQRPSRHGVPGRRLPQPLLRGRPQARGLGAGAGDRNRHGSVRGGARRDRAPLLHHAPGGLDRDPRACARCGTSSATSPRSSSARSRTSRSPRYGRTAGCAASTASAGRRSTPRPVRRR